MFQNCYKGRRVLVTGHTGFKGSWLSLFLEKLGAEVCGIALPVPAPNHFGKLNLHMRSEMCDIVDVDHLHEIIADFRPEIVFHLAAQPLVRASYERPVETFIVNVIGTLNVLECCRFLDSVRAVVAVTSDKCYENRETQRGYIESDPMGGYDPYSASKGCAELAITSFRRSFCTEGRLLVASARAGNVIGGGDWAADRLVPDLMRGAVEGRKVCLRNPRSTRPWQHVLEPLSGYLALGARLLAGDRGCACAWNFGPDKPENISVEVAACELARCWNRIKFECKAEKGAPHEAEKLQLDCSKSHKELHWHAVWDAEETFTRTALHYRDETERGVLDSAGDLNDYCADARKRGLSWAK